MKPCKHRKEFIVTFPETVDTWMKRRTIVSRKYDYLWCAYCGAIKPKTERSWRKPERRI